MSLIPAHQTAYVGYEAKGDGDQRIVFQKPVHAWWSADVDDREGPPCLTPLVIAKGQMWGAYEAAREMGWKVLWVRDRDAHYLEGGPSDDDPGGDPLGGRW